MEDIVEEAIELGRDDDLSIIVETDAPTEAIVERPTDFDTIVTGTYELEGVGQNCSEVLQRRSSGT